MKTVVPITELVENWCTMQKVTFLSSVNKRYTNELLLLVLFEQQCLFCNRSVTRSIITVQCHKRLKMQRTTRRRSGNNKPRLQPTSRHPHSTSAPAQHSLRHIIFATSVDTNRQSLHRCSLLWRSIRCSLYVVGLVTRRGKANATSIYEEQKKLNVVIEKKL